MPTYDLETIKAAHKHSCRHRAELQQSKLCGCFYCLKTFPPQEILDWVDEDNPKGPTALCPRCGIDSVIGSASGYPIAEEAFLRKMHYYWF